MGLGKVMTSRYGKDWDKYFLRIAKEVGSNSKCLSRYIGTVLVKDKSIVSTGYNGPPRGIPPCDSRVWTYVDPDGGPDTIRIDGVNCGEIVHRTGKVCPRYLIGADSGQRLDLCIAGHSERNALIQAAREGISTKGTELYCYCGPPCKDCVIEIINAGVETIVCLDGRYYDDLSRYLIKQSGINLIQYKEDRLGDVS